MAENQHRLSFEQRIYELEASLQKLSSIAQQNPEVRDEIRRRRRELTAEKKRIYGNLKPWQTVEVARHQHRP